MVFSSLTFLLVFLPALVVVFFSIPSKIDKARKYVLLFFSILFYAAGEPIYIFLILGCVAITWLLSGKVEEGNKVYLTVAITINLLPLLFFKYSGFIIENINAFTGITALSMPRVSLPIGISFYTFQILAYVIDLYKGNVKKQKNFLFLTLYILFFPQLIAGPIVRYQEVQDAITKNHVSWDNIQYGIGRFIIGLSKKVLIANQVGYVASEIRSHPLDSLSTGHLWLSVFSFALQIYFDFSGYSDMAIGLGSIFGFYFPENFNKPYMSLSVTDFWRRWHMTLGSFFRDYVYIPLGGNRVSKRRWIINVFIVWILTGLWHGAAWNYAIWGLYYAILLVMEKLFCSKWKNYNNKFVKCMRWVFTFFLVMLGWAIFLADDYSMSEFFYFIGRLLYAGKLESKVTIASMGLYGYIPFIMLGAFFAFPSGMIIDKIITRLNMIKSRAFDILNDSVLVLLLLLCIVYIIGGSYNPFIYYKF